MGDLGMVAVQGARYFFPGLGLKNHKLFLARGSRYPCNTFLAL